LAAKPAKSSTPRSRGAASGGGAGSERPGFANSLSQTSKGDPAVVQQRRGAAVVVVVDVTDDGKVDVAAAGSIERHQGQARQQAVAEFRKTRR
jgi:hypothetical protein